MSYVVTLYVNYGPTLARVVRCVSRYAIRTYAAMMQPKNYTGPARLGVYITRLSLEWPLALAESTVRELAFRVWQELQLTRGASEDDMREAYDDWLAGESLANMTWAEYRIDW